MLNKILYSNKKNVYLNISCCSVKENVTLNLDIILTNMHPSIYSSFSCVHVDIKCHGSGSLGVVMSTLYQTSITR